MERYKNDELFQAWLSDMDNSIERFRQRLPATLAGRLDSSSESLGALEEYVLEHYASAEKLSADENKLVLDPMGRYVGEVFRSHLGGKWVIEYTDEKKAFYGIPQLTGMRGQFTQMSPFALVTASAHRRTGTFIRSVFENYLGRPAN